MIEPDSDSRQERQVIDQPPDLVGLAHHLGQHLLQGGGIGVRGADRHLGLAAQDRQRRAQLVADIGKEVRTAGIDRPQPIVAGHQRLRPFAQFAGALFDLLGQRGLRLQQAVALVADLSGHLLKRRDGFPSSSGDGLSITCVRSPRPTASAPA